MKVSLLSMRSTRAAPTRSPMSSTPTNFQCRGGFRAKAQRTGISADFGVPRRGPIRARTGSDSFSLQASMIDRWMLYHSDTTLADQYYCYFAARQAGAEVTFDGAVKNLENLADRDPRISSPEDCSGLSSNDRIAPKTLAATFPQGSRPAARCATCGSKLGGACRNPCTPLE